MWAFEDELDEWFKAVERKRKERWGRKDDDDDEQPDMMENELARQRRGR